MPHDNRRGPLAGVRILDLTQFLSGPYGSQILADLGADVIKVEAPAGDLARYIPPHFVGEDSVYFHAINRNKRSIAVDMKDLRGLEIVRKLVLRSDVVFENFRPGVLDRLGLSQAELRAEKPDLVWCSISGYGQDGPYRDKPAYDMIVQALSGGMSLTGEPGRTAVRSGIPIGDLAAGMYAAIAILAAINRRNLSGEGDLIDISMLDCQVAMLSYQAAYYLFSGNVPGLQGTRHDSIVTYRGFECAGRTQIVVTANTERMWKGLCRALGLERLAADPLFSSARDRYERRAELWSLLEPAFLARTAAEWVPVLEREEIPVSVVNSLDQVVIDPQVVHRELVRTLSSASGDSVRVIGNPIRMEGLWEPADRMSPKLGQDTREVLDEVLGLSSEAIGRLIEGGIVGRPPKSP